jgi:hypothetical protein
MCSAIAGYVVQNLIYTPERAASDEVNEDEYAYRLLAP